MITWEDIIAASGIDYVDDSTQHDLLDGLSNRITTLRGTFAKMVSEHGIERAVEEMRRVSGLENLRLPDEYIDRKIQDLDESQGGKVRGIAHHTSIRRGTYSSTWGTPEWLITLIRSELGDIDLDLASSSEHNKIVKAKKFYSAEDLCPAGPEIAPGQVVFCNPPGPLLWVREFWDIFRGCVRRGAIGAFLIFNADHFRCLEAPDSEMTAIFLRKRLKYVGAKSSANFSSVLIWAAPYYPTKIGHALKWGTIASS